MRGFWDALAAGRSRRARGADGVHRRRAQRLSRSSATCPTGWAPRCCRRTCISARSRRGRVVRRLQRRAVPAATPTSTATSANWAGVNSRYHLLHHFPQTPDHNLNPRFDGFRWAAPNAAQLAGVAAGAHRRSDRRRRHARAVGHRLDAQPRAHAGGQFPVQAPAPALARRRALVLGHAGGRRPGQQHHGLAVGGRHRRRRGAVLPHLQSGDPGGEVRSAGALHHPLGARTGGVAAARRASRPGSIRTCWPSTHRRYPTLPLVDLAAGRDAALAAYRHTGGA